MSKKKENEVKTCLECESCSIAPLEYLEPRTKNVNKVLVYVCTSTSCNPTKRKGNVKVLQKMNEEYSIISSEEYYKVKKRKKEKKGE
ncbi:MAG: hypothetical protein QXO71_05305 [Candidatus Jordarchaeaceae archaeon]